MNMSLEFIRNSHVPSLVTTWRFLQSAIVGLLGGYAVMLMWTGPKETGFALGALVLSMITCGYASMMHDKVSAIRDQVDEIASNRRAADMRAIISEINEFQKGGDRG